MGSRQWTVEKATAYCPLPINYDMILVGFFIFFLALAVIAAFIVFAIWKKNRGEDLGEHHNQ